MGLNKLYHVTVVAAICPFSVMRKANQILVYYSQLFFCATRMTRINQMNSEEISQKLGRKVANATETLTVVVLQLMTDMKIFILFKIITSEILIDFKETNSSLIVHKSREIKKTVWATLNPNLTITTRVRFWSCIMGGHLKKSFKFVLNPSFCEYFIRFFTINTSFDI